MKQSLLPSSNLADIETTNNQPSKTWLVKDNKIVGYTDGKEAIKQSINMMLDTKRYDHLIFSWDYGQELNSLIGKYESYIKIEAPRLIKECLLQDDRISDVDNFTFTAVDDGLLIEFKVITAEGIIGSEVTL
ncbi:DUF2634 domain-containing protein [Vallitalea sp.]|jgi:hypothetical protein|uniref:DUF2634 domain-containing protein n=1 Tax=Vallitalea sp. TaxID=1882829 RepID=UPI0025F508D3|nr:DUF2634 domain-containing protein [Vallitalea sp.]MCT4686090.1 DUF2634 domain-containing protein [Vallitalea sp.]